MSRTVPWPMGHRTLRHSSSSGARSRIEWRGPAGWLCSALCPEARSVLSEALFISIGVASASRRNIGRGAFIGRRVGTGEETIRAQQAAIQSAAKRRPIPFSLIGIEGQADRAHLGIEIVKIMEQQGFAEHGQLR